MPVTKAAAKSLRQGKVRRARNVRTKDTIKTLLKQSRKFADQKQADKARESVVKAIKAIDKAIQKKILKKNTGARLKSRLHSYVKKSPKA